MRKYIGIGEVLCIIGISLLFYGIYNLQPYVAYTISGAIVLIIGFLIGTKSKHRT